MMQALHEHFQISIPKVYKFAPPYTLVCVLHWQILGHLLVKVSKSTGKIFTLGSHSSTKVVSGPSPVSSVSLVVATFTTSAHAPTATVSKPSSALIWSSLSILPCISVDWMPLSTWTYFSLRCGSSIISACNRII